MKKLAILLVVVLAAVLAVALVACNKEPTPVSYNVTVIYDGGSCTVSVEEGKTLSLDSLTLPEKSRMERLWVNEQKTVPYDMTAAVYGDITLYADLTRYYTVTFKDKDGNILKVEDVDEGESATAPVAPAVAGHSFDGWDVDFDNVTEDIDVNALYSPMSYTVTFNPVGGDTVYSPIFVFYGERIPVPAIPEKESFVFDYWYDATTDGSVPYDFSTAMPANDVALKARWTVHYNALPYFGVFDSSDHEAIVLNVYGDGFEISYALGDGEWQSEVPTVGEVGEYVVGFRISDGTDVLAQGQVTAVVAAPAAGSAQLTVTAKPQTVTYNGLPQAPSFSSEFYTFEGLAEGHTATAYSSFTATDAGEYSYSCTAVVVRDKAGNDVTDAYTLTSVASTFTVEKATANASAPTVYVDWDGNVHYYTKQDVTVAEPYNDQNIIIAGNGCATGGVYTFTVVLAGNDNWNEQIVSAVLAIRAARIGENTYTVEDALRIGGEIYLFGDAVISSSATVRHGTTLILPSSQDASVKVAEPTYGAGIEGHVDALEQYVEHTLTVNDGVTLTVHGDIIVCGLMGRAGIGISGHTSGKHSVLVNNGTINLLGGANLDIRGYVKGAGTVTAHAHSTIYAPFVVYDFRGGSNTAVAYLKGNIAPFNTYDMFYNVQCTLNIYGRAKYVSYLNLYAAKNHNKAQVNLISNNGGLINISEDAKAQIVFKNDNENYAGTVGYSEVTLTGDVMFGDLSMRILLVSISLSAVDLPLCMRANINIGDGITATSAVMPYKYKLLTGSTLKVAENASLTVEGKLTVYSEFTDSPMANLSYPDADAAQFIVNGTLVLADSAVFGGRIQSETAGKVVIGKTTTLKSVSTEGNCGTTDAGLVGMGGTYYLTFSLTEEARFDEGNLVISTDTPKTNEKNYSYVERVREYAAVQPLSAGTTYVYDGESWSAR